MDNKEFKSRIDAVLKGSGEYNIGHFAITESKNFNAWGDNEEVSVSFSLTKNNALDAGVTVGRI